MSELIDLTGQRFGRLAVVEYLRETTSRNGRLRYGVWRAVCDCGGKQVLASGWALRNEQIVSCGCHRRQITIERSTKHGHASRKGRTPIYTKWKNYRHYKKTDLDFQSFLQQETTAVRIATAA